MTFIDKPRDFGDFLTGQSGQFVGPFHSLRALFARHERAGSVERGNQYVRGGGGVDDIKGFLDIGTGKEAVMGEQNRTLGQRAHGFVERGGGHIGSGGHGRKGAMFILVVIVGAMGLVAKHGHMVGMGEFDNLFEGADRPEIGRVDNKNRLGRRITKDGFLPILERRLVGDFEIVIDFRHDIHRNRA